MTNVFDPNGLADLAEQIDTKIDNLILRLKEGMIVEEEDFSQKLLDAIESVVKGYTLDFKPVFTPGLSFSSAPAPIKLGAFQVDGRPPMPLHIDGRPLGRKGKGSEEKKTGADILLVLESEGIEGLAPRKGLLAQAKKKDGNFTYTGSRDLFDKCSVMAEITHHSFAFIYAHNGFFLFDNPVTKGVPTLQAHEASQSIGELIAEFIDCRVGDTRITQKRKGWFAKVAENLRDGRYQDAAEITEGGALVITANT